MTLSGLSEKQVNNINSNIKIKSHLVTDSDGICAIVGIRLFRIDCPENGQIRI